MSTERLTDGLVRAAIVLEARACWYLHGRFHFPLGDGWSFALSPDSAGRFRCEACLHGRPRDTLWVLAGDYERLAALAVELSSQVV